MTRTLCLAAVGLLLAGCHAPVQRTLGPDYTDRRPVGPPSGPTAAAVEIEEDWDANRIVARGRGEFSQPYARVAVYRDETCLAEDRNTFKSAYGWSAAALLPGLALGAAAMATSSGEGPSPGFVVGASLFLGGGMAGLITTAARDSMHPDEALFECTSKERYEPMNPQPVPRQLPVADYDLIARVDGLEGEVRTRPGPDGRATLDLRKLTALDRCADALVYTPQRFPDEEWDGLYSFLTTRTLKVEASRDAELLASSEGRVTTFDLRAWLRAAAERLIPASERRLTHAEVSLGLEGPDRKGVEGAEIRVRVVMAPEPIPAELSPAALAFAEKLAGRPCDAEKLFRAAADDVFQGRPAQPASVQATPQAEELVATTGADGRASLRLPVGARISVSVTPRGRSPFVALVEVSEDDLALEPASPADLRRDGSGRYTLVLPAGAL